MPPIAFVGAGNMAKSIIGGLISNGVPAASIAASATREQSLTALKEQYNIAVHLDNLELIREAKVIVLAVKPQKMALVCKQLAGNIADDTLIISIAAGITCASLEKWLGGSYPIVRCMPNTPSLVLKGASGLYASANVNQQQKDLSDQIMNAVGICCWVDEEHLIDAVTAVAGSAPAYFFLFIEAMIDSGISQGLEAEAARDLAIQTALGAATLAQQSETTVDELRRRVTSPNGTTERAIASLEANGLRDTVDKAMLACNKRAKELALELEE